MQISSEVDVEADLLQGKWLLEGKLGRIVWLPSHGPFALSVYPLNGPVGLFEAG